MATAEIVDLRTSDTLAGFDDMGKAEEALTEMVDENPEDARFLAVVYFDRIGHAIGSRMAEELSPA